MSGNPAPGLKFFTVFLIPFTVVLLHLAGCGKLALPRHAPGIGNAVDWDDLPGWETDAHAEAWPALLQSCRALEKKDRKWRAACLHARTIKGPGNRVARMFFETHFAPHALWGNDGNRHGLITGYYEPLLEGSRARTEVFRYPIHGRPRDLLIIDLKALFPDLAGRTLRGRLTDNGRVAPYFSRAQIQSRQDPLKGNEIAWVNDPVALFFLHIQGSGRIRLRDGTLLGVGYADRNGHPYVAIGRGLIRTGEIPQEKMSMQAIRDWLWANPQRIEEILNTNPNYIFFAARGERDTDPVGSLGAPLTPGRSIAVDPEFIPLGLPVWIDTTLPATTDEGETSPFRRLLLAQDTGNAIRGGARADVFFGSGRSAAAHAGRMRQQGRLYALLPK
uniref:Membrane-bound lytic murein transglycosylase A n=1 Tax=Candidatus Kentrum sp. SD TaxID=2126332 RepID=A0A450Y662_9GAMM|nr:MAG: membrane-bound lytic murein transglycosylase A [Candidatus Kentron sp. SD]VFK43077.1 MAG: membrane-bound lytic murein transglycosylase A [Candidatus Kentron sp. SD]VFK77730.1 MAG: membrane-bound lytic murein transglycosylase A [Candidatus Kentron sp. SD]